MTGRYTRVRCWEDILGRLQSILGYERMTVITSTYKAERRDIGAEIQGIDAADGGEWKD